MTKRSSKQQKVFRDMRNSRYTPVVKIKPAKSNQKNGRIPTFEEVYLMPLHSAKYGDHIWSANDVMAMQFEDGFHEKFGRERKNDFVALVNGVYDGTPFDFESINLRDAVDIYDGDIHIATVRGWGNLIGIGAWNLDGDIAAKIQDEFVNLVIQRLTTK